MIILIYHQNQISSCYKYRSRSSISFGAGIMVPGFVIYRSMHILSSNHSLNRNASLGYSFGALYRISSSEKRYGNISRVWGSQKSYYATLVRNESFTRTVIRLSISVSVYFQKSFMLNSSKNAGQTILTALEKQHMAHSVLALCRALSHPNMVKAVATNDFHDASQPVHEFMNYSHGTIQQKTTLLSVFGHNSLSLHELMNLYNNPKFISIDPKISVPIRSAAEIVIAYNFLKRFDSYIEQVSLTGDTINFMTKTNPFKDVIVNLKETPVSIANKRTLDIKSGNLFKGEYFKGEIRQITLDNGEVIWYPNKPVDIREEHYMPLTERLKSEGFLDQAQPLMTREQFTYLKLMASHRYTQLKQNESYQVVEDTLMKIQQLSTFPKAFNFINVVHVSDKLIMPRELAFVEKRCQYVNPQVLSNPRTMRHFMVKALDIYHLTHDRQIFNKIKSLSYTQEWLLNTINKYTDNLLV